VTAPAGDAVRASTPPRTAPPRTGSPSLAAAIADVDSRHPSGSDLEHLTAAAAIAEALDRCGEELVQHFVTNARARGESWSAIAEVLGVSRQAVHEKFATRTPDDSSGSADLPGETDDDST
jgi:hypothetical protein